MSGVCLLSGSVSFERCHVIDKGPECKNFIGAYKKIYSYSEYVPGIEDSQYHITQTRLSQRPHG